MKLAFSYRHLILAPVDELGVSGSAAPGASAGGSLDEGSPSSSSSNLPGQPKKKQKTHEATESAEGRESSRQGSKR